MPAGRPRKPPEVKILEGTFRADRDGDPATLVVADGAPAPGVRLAGAALALWKKVVPGLVSRGLAKQCDGPALTMMCQAWAAYQLFSAKVFRKGTKANPAKLSELTAANTAAAIQFDKFTSIASRFGLTPSDRAKLRVEQKPGGRQGVMQRKRG